jgi:hemoglobin
MRSMRKFNAAVMALAMSCGVALAAETVSGNMPVGSSPNAGNTPLRDDSAFKAFREKAGIDRISADFVGRISTDPRIGKYFQDVDLQRLSMELAAQFCYLLGGPCQYTGRDMKTVHAAMGLGQDDFNALAEDLQDAMDKEGISFSVQNRLIAKLAPMERAIVTK